MRVHMVVMSLFVLFSSAGCGPRAGAVHESYLPVAITNTKSPQPTQQTEQGKENTSNQNNQ